MIDRRWIDDAKKKEMNQAGYTDKWVGDEFNEINILQVWRICHSNGLILIK